jgi:hypothetical protein
MTRTFVDKNGNSWEWVETEETVKALQTYWNLVNGQSTGTN